MCGTDKDVFFFLLSKALTASSGKNPRTNIEQSLWEQCNNSIEILRRGSTQDGQNIHLLLPEVS